MSVLLSYQYFSNFNFFQLSVLVKYQYLSSYLPNSVYLSNITSIKLFKYQNINPVQVSKESVLLRYRKYKYFYQMCKHFSSISAFQVSINFKYQYFSIINTFQSSKISVLFKFQKYPYFLSLKSINIFHVSKVSIFFRYQKYQYL